MSENKIRAFRAGVSFAISIYIVYFLFGFGIFSALQITGLSFWFYKIIGLIAIIFGLIAIKNYIWYSGPICKMCEDGRGWENRVLNKVLKLITNPFGIFIIGFIVSLIELPCTGGPYLVILGLLAEKATQASAIALLLFYNLIFILPLLIITLLFYIGYSNVEKTAEWEQRNMRRIYLITGIIMVALGFIVIAGLI